MRTIFTILFLGYTALFAQINITSSDLLDLIGHSGTVLEDSLGPVTVNVGSSGADQSWDFSALSLQGNLELYSFMEPGQTPYTGQFPDANIVQRYIFSMDTTTKIYTYYNIQPNFVNYLGFVYSSLDSTGFQYYSEKEDLPVSYGNHWSSVDSFSIGTQGFGILTIDSTYTIVDGWGTVTVPAGTFKCLRLRENNTYITQSTFGDFNFSDTTTSISYEWITKDHFIVASIESQEDETNPAFTNAASVSLLQESNVTAIANNSDLKQPQKFDLLQNYPNPFNPQTSIKYQIEKGSNVSLKVYDNTGRIIKTLVNQWQPSGEYKVVFDGSDLASGVYLYRLDTNNFSQVKRMMLIK